MNRNNIIYQLLDESFVEKFLRDNLSGSAEFADLHLKEIKPHKKHIWDRTYHVVFEYVLDVFGREISIFCAAHSDEPREEAFRILQFLEKSGFANDLFLVPRPLFYSGDFRALFYIGLEGVSLHHFLKDKKYDEIERAVKLSADWLVRFHSLSSDGGDVFNSKNNYIRNVVPGIEVIMRKIDEKYPELLAEFKSTYSVLVEREESFLSSTEQRWFVHGDFHSENIIVMANGGLGVIDFADFCLSDFARDVGSFCQQLEFKASRRISHEYGVQIREYFLECYLESAGIEMTNGLRHRIDTYYAWTAMRTATYFLLRSDSALSRARGLMDAAERILKIHGDS